LRVDEQFISAHVSAYPADTGHVFVFNRNTGHSDVLQAQLFGILRQADHFDTIAGHERKLLSAGWEDDRSGFIESAHRELIARGLLVSKSAFQKCLNEKGGKVESPPPVTSIVIPTRDRISELQRCAGGFIENAQKYGRKVDFLVIDDSRSENQGAKVRPVLTPFAARARLSYAGKEEKLAFLTELVMAGSADGLPESVVAFCLFGNDGYAPAYAVNRNAALLATAGELFVMTDDDTVCKPVDSGAQERTLRLTSQRDPTVLRFYSDRRELLAAVHVSEVDIISCHEKLLGRSIVDCQSGLGSDCTLDVDQIGPGFAGTACRMPMVVRATMAGVWGDSGMGSPNAALEFTGESRDLVERSKAEYVRATNSREVFRSVSRYTASDGSLFMAANGGVDNRTLLPPFFPVGRNEDRIFALTLRICAENALIGHLPIAIHHAPAETRHFPQGAFLAVTPRLSDIITAIMRSFTPSPWVMDGSQRLAALGRHFADLGELETDDFEDQVKAVWLAAAGSYIGYLENLLELYDGQPEYWATDVLSLIGNFNDFITQGSPVVPREFLETNSPDQAAEICRQVVRKYGELLQWWPVIYSAAVTLRENGIRLGQPV
jgi:hypothetical protein